MDCVRLLVLALLCLAAPSPAQDLHDMVSCDTRNGRVVVDFGMTKHPTFFAIETPKGEFLYLRYAPGNIDTLGKRYLQNPLELELSRLQGFAGRDDKATPRKVFSAPGKYVLRFQDANTMAGIGLHKLSCEVWIAALDATVARSRHPASAVATEGTFMTARPH